ncbi:hypothetical protein EV294_112131 [Paenibacillus sp. BK033]|uniref:hypothetical protein n=1 Tax=Paenibacillus sp. BK033 TaxID=2512133 RepID=UPI00104DEEDE|nr:hypothetical protein [Paenibacillus sp. BK033]TCM89666.1 hypothetical protein EV294_112131 [Paenibacillus sp. BK033]
MNDPYTQRMTEIMQQSEAYYTARITELTAEVKRLRTNMTKLQTYAETKAAEFETKDGGFLAVHYYRGKVDAYGDIGARACVAYLREGSDV